MFYYPIVVVVLTLLNQGNLTHVTIPYRLYAWLWSWQICFTVYKWESSLPWVWSLAWILLLKTVKNTCHEHVCSVNQHVYLSAKYVMHEHVCNFHIILHTAKGLENVFCEVSQHIRTWNVKVTLYKHLPSQIILSTIKTRYLLKCIVYANSYCHICNFISSLGVGKNWSSCYMQVIMCKIKVGSSFKNTYLNIHCTTNYEFSEINILCCKD
jgi:hypothetical protein